MRWLHTSLIAALLLGSGAGGVADEAAALKKAAKQPVLEAIVTLEGAAQRSPEDALVQARLSQAYSLGTGKYLSLKEKRKAGEAARKAVAAGEQAVALDEQSADAHLALSIAYGKLTDFVDNRTKMQLSAKIRDEALRTLELNEKEDIAHHILGRWNFGIATLNPILKVTARAVYGRLPEASKEEAVAHMKKAVALQPTRVIHHWQLAKMYDELKQPKLARAHWEKVVALPAVDSEDKLAKREAEKALR